MDDQYVDVYIDSRPRAYTYLRGGSLAEEIRLNQAPTGIRPRGACTHASPQVVFAYARVLEVHWPIAVCNDCLAILEGRKPFALESNDSVALEDVITRRWAKDWPQAGKPRTKRPPAGIAWPKTT
jgi:hypothetical protein